MNLLSIYKTVNIRSHDFNIYKNSDGELLFDLITFSTIHCYSTPKYLVTYYGRGRNPINIFYKSYTDWSGMVILCSRARKNGIRESYNILYKKLITEMLSDCVICYERKEDVVLNCKHKFCRICIVRLHRSNINFVCPCCRANIICITSF
jgi:hypothetical protein